MSHKQHVFLTGLPRSGSTLLAQLLAHHPDVHCDGMSSPLHHMIENVRHKLADDSFFLSRLDNDWDGTYQRLTGVYRGMISNWMDNHERPVSIDKNRGWLRSIEATHYLDPEAKFVVCIRELSQIFGSIENAHKKSIILAYRDHIPQHSEFSRSELHFSPGGVVGGPLKSLLEYIEESSNNYPDLINKVYFVAYEPLITNTVQTLNNLAKFLGISEFDIDINNLKTLPASESDSHYGMKWPHKTYSSIRPMRVHDISSRITKKLQEDYGWYYQNFYPASLQK